MQNKETKGWRDWFDIIIGYPLMAIVVLFWVLTVIFSISYLIK